MRALLNSVRHAPYEACLVVEAARRPRDCLPSWLMLIAGVAYTLGPINLIPDSTPYIGHLDEATFSIGGIVGARYFMPTRLRRLARQRRSRQAPGESLRRYCLRCGALVFGGAVLRLCLGRWPDRDETRLFRAGIADGEAVLPPILRGLHGVPAAKEPIGNLAVLNLVREGVVRKPPDLGPLRVPMPPQPGNPLSYWDGPALSFLHFEKTAGTSVASLLTGLFHPLQIDDDPERGTAPHVLSAFPISRADEFSHKAFVWGHYDLPALRRLDPTRPVITTLRRPRERVLSLYRFWRSVDPRLVRGGHVSFNVAAAHEMDLLSFLRSDDPLIRNYVDNVYVRRLTGTYVLANEDDDLHGDPFLYLDRALRELQELQFVGIVEQMDVSLLALADLIGIRLPSRPPRRNGFDEFRAGRTRGFRSIERPEVSPAIELELARLTRLDDVVYEAAVARLRADSLPAARSGHAPALRRTMRGDPRMRR